MEKIYLNKANENWILDRLRSEWYRDQATISTKYVWFSNIIWICSPWTWKNISKKQLMNKKVVCSIYHIDEAKFSTEDSMEFDERDKYVDFYHVISENTKNQLKKYTNKTIISIPFWADSKMWHKIDNLKELRTKYNLPQDSFIVGSFQRDTEGHDLVSPKLSKGPDRFIKIIKNLSADKNIHVLLSGKRRNYVMTELEKLNIPYTYFEMVNQTSLNELYNCLDLYIVASRVEGGPQSIVECALSQTPIISTDVGIAPEILSPKSIFDMKTYDNASPDVDYAYNNAIKLKKPTGYKLFIEMFRNLNEN